MEKNIEAVEQILLLDSNKRKSGAKSFTAQDIRLLASLFVCQFFSVVAARDFVEASTLKKNTILNSMLGILQLSDE